MPAELNVLVGRIVATRLQLTPSMQSVEPDTTAESLIVTPNHEASSELGLSLCTKRSDLLCLQIGTFTVHGGVKHGIQDFNQITAEEYATSVSVKSFSHLVAKCDCIPCGLRFDYADVSLIAADLGPNCEIVSILKGEDRLSAGEGSRRSHSVCRLWGMCDRLTRCRQGSPIPADCYQHKLKFKQRDHAGHGATRGT